MTKKEDIRKNNKEGVKGESRTVKRMEGTKVKWKLKKNSEIEEGTIIGKKVR